MPEHVRERYEQIGRRRIILLLWVGVLLLTVAIGAAVITLSAITRDTEAVQNTLERQGAIDRLATFNEQIAAGRRGFLLQPDPTFAKVVREASSDYEAEQADLKEKIKSPEQRQRLDRVSRLNAERTIIIDSMFADPQAAFAEARERDFSQDRSVLITQEIRSISEQMSDIEEGELSLRNQAQLQSLIRFYLVGGLAIVLLLGTMLSAVMIVMRYNRELNAAQVGLRQANLGLEEAVQRRTGELVRANHEIQRFAYIVSHDLRSPLVNVLGFTAELDEARKAIHAHLSAVYEARPELRDEQAWLAVDEDLPEALGFIRTSTEKMDRLINSILELSRQGRRNLAPQQLDMDEVVTSVVASLHQRVENAGAQITVADLPDVESDRMAVEQILQNLIENAIKYLNPQRRGEIVIEGERSGPMVHIDVVDNGRGIAPDDHERIFDLFRRAGPQDQQGEGIGLANVRALAYRLGGNVTVQSQLDEGSRFRLSLPRKFVAQEALT